MLNCRSQNDFMGNTWSINGPGARAGRANVAPRGISQDNGADEKRIGRLGQPAAPAKVFEGDGHWQPVKSSFQRNESQPAVQNTKNCGNFDLKIQNQNQIQLVKKNNENLNKVDIYEGIEQEEEMEQMYGQDGALGTEQNSLESRLLQPQIITQRREAENEMDPYKRKPKLTRARSGADIDLASIIEAKERQNEHETAIKSEDNAEEVAQEVSGRQTLELPQRSIEPNQHQLSTFRELCTNNDTMNTISALSMTQPLAVENLASSVIASKLSESKISQSALNNLPTNRGNPLQLSSSALLNFEELIESKVLLSQRDRLTTVEEHCASCGSLLINVCKQAQVPTEALPPCLSLFQGSNIQSQPQNQKVMTANCQNCGSFLMIVQNNDGSSGKKQTGGRSRAVCQAVKDHPGLQFRPDFSMLRIMRSLKKYTGPHRVSEGEEMSCAFVVYNQQAKYLKYRRKTVRTLFQTSERFGFNNDTVHHAIALFDGTLIRRTKAIVNGELLDKDAIEALRARFPSCKGVISEQICTFVASVSLFISAKYHEIKYPVVEDVCQLMQCPFTFDEFVEMEAHLLEDRFQWDLQIPTVIEALQAMLSQGVLFSTDTVTFTQKQENESPSKQESQDDKTQNTNTKTTVPITETNETQMQALFSRINKLCLSLLPNLLVYDASLTLMATQESSPVHLALAIIMEARRSLGVSIELTSSSRISDIALLFMAFGDGLLPNRRFYATNENRPVEPEICQQSAIQAMLPEMQSVYRLVEKIQQSLYNKTFASTYFKLNLEDKISKQIRNEDELERVVNKCKKGMELDFARGNPTPLTHSAESGVLESTQPTTEPVKSKDQQVDREGRINGERLRVSQLKVDDGHIEGLKFPSQSDPQESARRPEMLPQIQIDGFTSRTRSKYSSAQKSESQEEKCSSNKSNQATSQPSQVQRRPPQTARGQESARSVPSLLDDQNQCLQQTVDHQKEMTIYESLKVECPPTDMFSQVNMQAADLVSDPRPQPQQHSTYYTVRSQSSARQEEPRQPVGPFNRYKQNCKAATTHRKKQSKSKSSASAHGGSRSKSAWSHNGEFDGAEIARAKPVRASAQMDNKETKQTESADVTSSIELPAKPTKSKAPATFRARKASGMQLKQSAIKPILQMKRQPIQNGSRNNQPMTSVASAQSLHNEMAGRNQKGSNVGGIQNGQNFMHQKKKSTVGKLAASAQVAFKLKSERRKNSVSGAAGVKPVGAAIQQQSSQCTKLPSQRDLGKKNLTQARNYRKSSQMRSHCSYTNTVGDNDSVQNSSSSAVRNILMQQESCKRLTAGKFHTNNRQRSKDSKRSDGKQSNDRTSESRGQARNPLANHYLTQTLQHQQNSARGVVHNQPRVGNVSFRGLRSMSQRGSAAAAMTTCVKSRSSSRNVTSGSGIVASASANAGQAERPGTSRVNVKHSQQSSRGYVTARAEQAASVIGPKILSQSKTQSLLTIQQPKAPEVLLTEGNMAPSLIQQLQAGQQAYFTENIESTSQTPLSTHNSISVSLRNDGKHRLKQNAGPLFASRQQSRRGGEASYSHSKMSPQLGSNSAVSSQPSTLPTHGQTSTSKVRLTVRSSCGAAGSVSRRQTNPVQQKLPLKAVSGDLQKLQIQSNHSAGLQKPPKSGGKLVHGGAHQTGLQKQAQGAMTLNKSSTKPQLGPSYATTRTGGKGRKSPIINRIPCSRQGLTKGGSSKMQAMLPCSQQLQQAPGQLQKPVNGRLTPRGDGDALKACGQPQASALQHRLAAIPHQQASSGPIHYSSTRRTSSRSKVQATHVQSSSSFGQGNQTKQQNHSKAAQRGTSARQDGGQKHSRVRSSLGGASTAHSTSGQVRVTPAAAATPLGVHMKITPHQLLNR